MDMQYILSELSTFAELKFLHKGAIIREKTVGRQLLNETWTREGNMSTMRYEWEEECSPIERIPSESLFIYKDKSCHAIKGLIIALKCLLGYGAVIYFRQIFHALHEEKALNDESSTQWVQFKKKPKYTTVVSVLFTAAIIKASSDDFGSSAWNNRNLECSKCGDLITGHFRDVGNGMEFGL